MPAYHYVVSYQYWGWCLLALVVGVFILAPCIDIGFSALFYTPEEGFFLRDNPFVRFIYGLFRDIPYIWVPMLVWLWIASWLWARKSETGLRRVLLFLLVSLALGPGLLVNGILKAESGRARPQAVEQFGGDKTFSPPLVISDQCESNCSFVSGHAAMGFYFIVFAWAFGNHRWLYVGIGMGALVGLGRIVQGGHFLSDVIFSFVAVYAVGWLCARWLLGRTDVNRIN